MNSFTVYLAEPIDQSGERVQDYGLREALVANGASVYSPRDAWTSFGPNAAVQGVNDAAIELADVVVALLPDGVASIGVPFEVGTALATETPTVVMGGDAAHASPVLVGSEAALLYPRDVDLCVRWVLEQVFPQEWASTDMADVDLSAAGPLYYQVVTDHMVHDEQGDHYVGFDPHGEWLATVHTEMMRAEAKHPGGESNTVARWFAVWAEEVVEVFQAWNDKQDWADREAIATEVVQVGAMSGRLWEALMAPPMDLFNDPDVGQRPVPPGMLHDRAREREASDARWEAMGPRP